MTVRVYRSTDASAPALSGTAGALVGVLDAVLVNGYGAQTAAGWTIEFTTTNARAYRMSTTSPALGYYLRVNDSGVALGADETAGTPTVKEARLRGYEAMTGISTGTNAFPTTTQSPVFGLLARKSTTVDTVVRPWIIIADQRTFYMFVLTGDVANTYYCWGFGEFYSFKTSDFGRAIIAARNLENSSAAGNEPLIQVSTLVGSSTIINGNSRFLARSYTGQSGAINGTSNVADPALNATQTLDFTNLTDNKVYAAPIRITENSTATTASWRGRHRGLLVWPHPTATASNGDTFTGSGDLAGKSFLVLKLTAGTTNTQSILILETSDTWDTNAS